MENRFFEEPRCHDRAFYDNRPAADHINQASSALRIHLAVGYAAYVVRFQKVRSVGDFGCGTGGGLMLLSRSLLPEGVRLYGYDLCPANVEMARSRGLDVVRRDFVNEEVEWPELMIMTETLEHLIDPHGFLKRIPRGTWVVLTVPLADDGKRHDTTHLWGWTEKSFPRMCAAAGFDVHRWEELMDKFQVLIGRKER